MRSALVPLYFAGWMLSVSLAPQAARAETFVGTALGLGNQQLVCAAGAACDKRAAVIRAFGGWRFNNRFGTELAWTRNLGDFTASDRLSSLTWLGKVRVQVLSASATFIMDAGALDLQLRAGVAAVRGEFESRTAGVADSKDTQIRPVAGLGLRHALNDHWTLRADADLTDAQAYTRKGHHTTFTVGIERRF